MVRARSRAGLIPAALMLAGCTGAPDPLERAVLHAVPPGEGIRGDAATAVAAATGLAVEDDAGFWVGATAPPEPDGPWARHEAREDGVALWVRQDPLQAPRVAVEPDAVPGPVDPDGWLRGWLAHGRDPATGEIVAEAFLRLPRAIPTRVCLALDAGGARVDLGPVLDGGHRFIPGARQRPVIRHRLRHVDPAFAAVDEADLHLVHCRTGTDLAPPQTVALPAGRTSLEGLRAWSGSTDPDAAFAEPPRTRDAIHRGADGTMQVRPGPPLPRVERGEAWGLLTLSPLDPSDWDAAALMIDGKVAVGPLTALQPLFEEAETVVLGWDAPASRVGPTTRPAEGAPRRVVPETLLPLPALGVDALLPGPHLFDAGDEGMRATIAAARRVGLRAGGDSVVIGVGEGERAVRVLVANAPAGSSPGQLYGDDPGLRLVQAHASHAPLDLVRQGFDGAWILDETLDGPRVQVIDGVPIVRVPPIGVASRTAYALRWYVAPEGVRRVDVVPLVRRAGTWSRDDGGTLRGELLEAAEDALAHDTWVAVGQTVAAVDVAAHFARERPAAKTPDLAPLEPGPLPEPVRPPRCTPEDPSLDTPLATFGGAVVLESAEVLTPQVAPGEPVRVALTWRRASGAALPRGEVQWYGAGLERPWRATHVPCAGSWGFQHWGPGERVRDEVWLVPSADLGSGEARLDLRLRLGEGQPTTASGERDVTVGTVRIAPAAEDG